MRSEGGRGWGTGRGIINAGMLRSKEIKRCKRKMQVPTSPILMVRTEEWIWKTVSREVCCEAWKGCCSRVNLRVMMRLRIINLRPPELSDLSDV